MVRLTERTKRDVVEWLALAALVPVGLFFGFMAWLAEDQQGPPLPRRSTFGTWSARRGGEFLRRRLGLRP